MKKIFAVILILLLAFALVSCRDKDNKDDENGTTTDNNVSVSTNEIISGDEEDWGELKPLS